jgi:hypothetical protein
MSSLMAPILLETRKAQSVSLILSLMGIPKKSIKVSANSHFEVALICV